MLDAAIPPGEAVARLAEELREMGADGPDCERLLKRLMTTLHGVDLKAGRPNLVLALSGAASENAGTLVETLARALFGADDRVITVDLSPIQDEEHLSVLVGSMPGYVGYGRRLPIHALEVTPRCVVVFAGADLCHPLAAEIVAKGLAQGYIADTTGARYHLSDAVVVLPASTRRRQGGSAVPLGFIPASASATDDAAEKESLDKLFGPALAEQVDVQLCELGARVGARDEVVIAQAFLPGIAERYERHGVVLSWEDSVAAHLAGSAKSCTSRADLERLVEDWVSELVVPTLGQADAGKCRSVRLRVEDGQGRVEIE
jgi:ATP-dependent Clp protease ATP-binding subunit ClpC